MTFKQASKTARPNRRPLPTHAFPLHKRRVRTALATDPGYLLGGIAPGITSYTRDARGLITGQSNSNGTNSAFSFDGNRRVTFVNHTVPGGGTLLQIGYTHDAAGNPLTKSTSNGDYVYQYDENNQLVYEETPTGFTSLTYDSSFRRIQQLDALGLTEFVYNTAGQLLYSTGARPATCTYDDNGNTTSIQTLAGLTSYAWDDLGRLSGATVPGNKILTMTYRFDHLLSSKTGPNGTQQLLWDGQNVATASGPASAALPAAAGCVFLGTDTTTQGNWMGVYGADGYNIIEDTVDYPSYLSFSQTGGVDYIFAYSTTDVRALERVLGGRRAAEWFNDTTFTLNMNFTDGKPHKVSIYCLDWDETTRTQTVAVLDAVSGTVLNTQDLNTSFNGGIYLSWTIRGHVQLVFTNTNMTYNAVVSGLFFDSFPTAPTGGYGVVAAGAGLTRSIGVDSNGYPVVRQYHTDGQGSVLAITDGLGNVVTGYQIDAWGNVLYGGAPGNAFDYLGGLGYWADPDLSLHYVRARWMNPAFGNWLSVDPHLDEFAYQYAGNAPTTSTDPSGMAPPEFDSNGAYAASIRAKVDKHITDRHNLNDSELQNALKIHLTKAERDWVIAEMHRRGMQVPTRSGASGPGSPSPDGKVGEHGAPPTLSNHDPSGKAASKPHGATPGGGPTPPKPVDPAVAKGNAILGALMNEFGLPTVMVGGRLMPAASVRQSGTSGAIAQRQATIADLMLQESVLTAGPMMMFEGEGSRMLAPPPGSIFTSDHVLAAANARRLAAVDSQLGGLGVTPPQHAFSVDTGQGYINQGVSALISGKPIGRADPSAVGAALDRALGAGTNAALQGMHGFGPTVTKGVISMAEPKSLLMAAATGPILRAPFAAKTAFAAFGVVQVNHAVHSVAQGQYGDAAGDLALFLGPLAIGKVLTGATPKPIPANSWVIDNTVLSPLLDGNNGARAFASSRRGRMVVTPAIEAEAIAGVKNPTPLRRLSRRAQLGVNKWIYSIIRVSNPLPEDVIGLAAQHNFPDAHSPVARHYNDVSHLVTALNRNIGLVTADRALFREALEAGLRSLEHRGFNGTPEQLAAARLKRINIVNEMKRAGLLPPGTNPNDFVP